MSTTTIGSAKVESNSQKGIVYLIALIAALGGLLFGLDQGFVANALSTISAHYNLSTAEKEHFTAILSVGCMIGPVVALFSNKIIGRKYTIIISGFLFASMSLISTMVPSYEILFYARLFLGVAVGIAAFTVPIYLIETSPKSKRGTFGTYWQLMITVGIFAVSFINSNITMYFGETVHSLVLMYGVLSFFSVLMFVCVLIIPESPRYLMLKGKRDEALQVLRRTRNSEQEVNEELAEIEEATKVKTSFISFLTKPFFWKIVALCGVLQFFQQTTGINTLIYYGPSILEKAGFAHGLFTQNIIYVVNMLATFIAIKYIDQAGRVKLLTVGGILVVLSLLLAAFSYNHIVAGVALGFYGYLFLAATLLFIIGFACSWGPITWILVAELFPLKSRELGVTLSTVANYAGNTLVAGTSLTFISSYGISNLMLVFAAITVVALIVVKVFCPETKGVSIESIEKKFESGTSIKNVGI